VVTQPNYCKVLHVNSSDYGGGAEALATRMAGRQRRGSLLCVGKKSTSLPFVFEFRRNLLDHLLGVVGKVLRRLGLRKTTRQLLGINDL
jgi:hypothetical protein